MNSMLRSIGGLVAGLVLGLAVNVAAAQPGPGGDCGMGGPGMMGGYGDHEIGPGMGMGRGMIDGYGGHGMGAGMGMGRGMMGGYGDHGMGAGMMDSHGGRSGGYAGLGLTADQRAKIERIHRDLRTKNWPLMGKMMEARYKLSDLYDADKPDATAIKAQYKAIEDLRLQMVDAAVDAHSQVDALLTAEQKEKARQRHHGLGE